MISQYVLIFIAVTFTWLMGLMGYVRSTPPALACLRCDSRPVGRRIHAHARLRHEGVSATVLLFFLLIGLVFWISSLHDRPDFARKTRHREGAGEVSPDLAKPART